MNKSSNIRRSSGILMHISSLPSKYGIGTLGKEAFKFVDFLKASGQAYWQILPIGPVSYHDSPYQSFSTFAGNPYFIDFELLTEQGILKESDYADINWGLDAENVDYGLIYKNRFNVLQKAYSSGIKNKKLAEEFSAFVNQNLHWLPDFSFFMALKAYFKNLPYTSWDPDIRLRNADAVNRYKMLLKDEIETHSFIQFLFFGQWKNLKAYANSKGIKIIGDIPVYVAGDSSDVWANPDLFQLDEDLIPKRVAGVPPDAFSADGQLWGNPLYDWEVHRKDNYRWWVERIRAAINIYDIVRIDHFRGFESYFSIKFGEKTAKHGEWVKGPGIELFDAINKNLPNAEIIAEDLGFLTDDVYRLLEATGYPGMKILLFGLEAYGNSDYLPYKYKDNCIAYIGTHDNDTIMGWMDSAPPANVKYAKDFMRLSVSEGYNWGMIKTLMACNANLSVFQMQDILGLGNEARMNIPSVKECNWRWRMKNGAYDKKLSEKLFELTKLYMRL